MSGVHLNQAAELSNEVGPPQTNRTATDNYFVRIQPNTQDTRINIAIDDGL